MELSEFENYGINYQEGIARCLNDEEIYRFMIEKFLEDDTFLRAKADFEAKNYEGLQKTAHELKGVSGNASIPEMYESTRQIVECLRSVYPKYDEIDELFKKVESSYDLAVQGFTKYLGK